MPKIPLKMKPKYAKKNQQLATIATVKRMISGELENKYFPVTGTTTNVDSSNAIGSALCLVTQGVSDSQRVGDVIMPTRLEFRGIVHLGATQITSSPIRLIFFRYENDDNSPVAAQLFQDSSQALVSTCPAHDYRSKYIILHDETFNLPYTATLGGVSPIDSCKVVKIVLGKSKMKKIQFQAGITTGQNRIFYCFLSDKSSVGTVAPTILWYSRLDYTDA